MSTSPMTEKIRLIKILDRVRPKSSGLRMIGPKPASPESDQLRPRPKVLVVDDSPEIRKIIEFWGRRCGVAVFAAEDAPEAFQLLLEHAFQLVFLDLHLPAMSGFDVLKGMRSILRTCAHLPIRTICLTASREERARCLAAGFDDFLEKPFRSSALSDLLTGLWSDRPASCKTPEEDPGIADLLPAYLRNRKEDIRMMKDALAVGDYKMIESLAHKIRGSAANFGFPEMTDAGRLLERAAKEEDLAHSLACLRQLEVCVSRAQSPVLRPRPLHPA